MAKNNYLIWSGGADSTCLLEILSRQAAIDNPLKVITIISDECNSKGNRRMEAKARKKIKSILKDRPIKYKEVTVNIDYPEGKEEKKGKQTGLPQVTFWLGAVIPFLGFNPVLHFGYIKSDDFWHYRHHIDTIIQGMFKINGIKNVEIKYPLEWYDKKSVTESLINTELFDHVWFCEEPVKDKPCGKCGSCLKQKNAFWGLGKTTKTYFYKKDYFHKWKKKRKKK